MREKRIWELRKKSTLAPRRPKGAEKTASEKEHSSELPKIEISSHGENVEVPKRKTMSGDAISAVAFENASHTDKATEGEKATTEAYVSHSKQVSEGAELIKLNKAFFISFMSDKCVANIVDQVRTYQDPESIKKRVQLDMAWKMWQRKVVDETMMDIKNHGRTVAGFYFQEPKLVLPRVCPKLGTVKF
nr:hypothetical protein BaRGS_031500 [Batillaria attramentaria]